MADTDTEEDAPKKKGSKLPLLIGLVLALAGGGGGFYAVYSGMILGDGAGQAATADAAATGSAEPLPDIGFVEVEPMVISIGAPASTRHLRFRTQLEVADGYRDNVERILPRVVDVLNSYLRALRLEDLEDPAALVRLRAQMLRRVQLVTGEGRVNDLLIMEFVLN
jgi:flagellar FliL protein